MDSTSLQDAVRAAAAELKRKLLEPEAPVPAVVAEEILVQAEIPKPPEPEPPPPLPPPAPAASLPVQEDVPAPLPPAASNDLESLIRGEFSAPLGPQAPEERQALESVLGISVPQPPPPPRPPRRPRHRPRPPVRWTISRA